MIQRADPEAIDMTQINTSDPLEPEQIAVNFKLFNQKKYKFFRKTWQNHSMQQKFLNVSLKILGFLLLSTKFPILFSNVYGKCFR